MGQVGDEHPIICSPKPRRASLFSCGLLLALGVVACSDLPLWVESNESCVFESQEPPLQRVVNYAHAELCDRQPVVKKKRQKRLRELFPEE